MVGELRDKVWRFGGRAGRRGPSRPGAVGVPPQIRIELTRQQLDAVLLQWNEKDRNAPTEVVVTVDAEPVGVLHVIASYLVDPSTIGRTTEA
jgi:hypothetical protein